MNYQTFSYIIDSLSKVLQLSTISSFGPPMLAFFIGFSMGSFDFARYFSNSIKSVIMSSSGFIYCFINGSAVVLALLIVNLLNIQILGLKFSNDNYIAAAIVGIVGYIGIFTRISNNNNDDKELTNIFMKALSQTQKLFFDRYTLMREVELRPQLKVIMDSVDNNLIIMLSDCCTGIAKNMDEKRGTNSAERLLKIHSSAMPIQIKKIEIGLEHVKNIGLEYFKLVVEEFKSSPLPKSLEEVDNKISELQKISEMEGEK